LIQQEKASINMKGSSDQAWDDSYFVVCLFFFFKTLRLDIFQQKTVNW